jgi:hypothetical protein
MSVASAVYSTTPRAHRQDGAQRDVTVDEQELNALEKLENARLGDLRGELVGAREHYGAELQRTQKALHAHRARRLQMRAQLAGDYPSAGALDSALSRMPEHEALHRCELMCRDRARNFNWRLKQLIVALEMVDEEMLRRIKARGFETLHGHAHLFRTDQARLRRRRRRRLQRSALRVSGRNQ